MLDARESRELRATVLALANVDRTLRKMVRQYTKAMVMPEWRQALAERANTRLEQRVLVDTSVVTVSDRNVRMQSASKGRPLTGGLAPKLDYYAVEYGADQNRQTTYNRRSRKGTVHPVTRRVGNTLKPRSRRGYVFGPAARQMVPRVASLWVQTTVRTIANALEGKQE